MSELVESIFELAQEAHDFASIYGTTAVINMDEEAYLELVADLRDEDMRFRPDPDLLLQLGIEDTWEERIYPEPQPEFRTGVQILGCHIFIC